jgi:hypothetical protein
MIKKSFSKNISSTNSERILRFYELDFKEFFKFSAKMPNLFAIAVISSIEAVSCSADALIPSIELNELLILSITLLIFSFVSRTADFDSSANLRTSSAPMAKPRDIVYNYYFIIIIYAKY